MVLSNAQWFNKTEAYTIDQSCRFNDDDSAYLSKTWGSAGNQTVWTVSVWVKRGNITSTQYIFGANNANDNFAFRFNSSDQLEVWDYTSGYQLRLATTAVYRDVGSWYHIVFAYDSTPSTPSSSSIKLFVNGEQVTAFGTATYPSQNEETWWNDNVLQTICSHALSPYETGLDGYLSEFVFIDGLALEADSFGETNSDTGQWVPKSVSGLTFGTNGFLLAFQDSSALGDDTSGNGNDFASSGLAAADQTPDSPTLNRAVLNAAQDGSSATAVMSEGNTRVAVSGSTRIQRMSTIPLVGKVYWEVLSVDNTQNIAGICDNTVFPMEYNDFQELLPPHVMVYDNANLWYNSSYTTYSQPSNGQRRMFAFDADTGELWGGVNGTWHNSGDPAAGTGEVGTVGTTTTWFIVIGGKSDADQQLILGSGNMSHTVPSGFTADLDVSQLADPTIADPSGSFQSTIYTGDGATTLAVNQGGNSTFTPDFVWVKNRDQADAHLLFDLPRGVTNYLISNTGGGQATGADTVESFDSDGFTVGDDVRVNTSGEKYVGWQWLESDTAGFDVFTFTGTGSAHTISHSLGVVPELIIIKNQNITSDWWVYHAANTSAPATDYLVLNGTDTTTDSATAWNDTAPTSSVFTVGTASNVNGDGNSHIAYIFAPVESFSKFGSYTGNGNADGPFVWCGFRPAFIVEKNTNSADDWVMWDNQRNPYNVSGTVLKPNTSGAETTATSKYIDFLSNGFKLRASDTGVNGNGNVHCFWAFSDTPFKTATAR
jgi:hypothetical protein